MKDVINFLWVYGDAVKTNVRDDQIMIRTVLSDVVIIQRV